MFTTRLASLWLLALSVGGALAQSALSTATNSAVSHGLKVSPNQRHLVDAETGQPVFILADTAWNLNALKLDEVDTYLDSRVKHGFNLIMFALNFSPQGSETNAYGQSAYLGADKTELNPAYFEYCDAVVKKCAERGLYVMLYAMWAGTKSGTMNNYTAEQLRTVGAALGRHYRGVKNVILCAGGEASPHYIKVEQVNALGAGLAAGCAGENLVTVHPVSGNSTSKFYADSPWLDFYMSQGKSGNGPVNTAYDAAELVAHDWRIEAVKPTMMSEHRYESGTDEDPLIQRRSLYQCVFAGGCGYAYGHNALWQMTPHTAQAWMLKGWNPGVKNWREALDTKAVRQFKHIKTLLDSHPWLERIPDQSLVLAGQGTNVFKRVQAMRDGRLGNKNATCLMAYLSAPGTVTLDTSVIAARTLRAYWFDPENGDVETIEEKFSNIGSFAPEKRTRGDAVIVIEDATKTFRKP